MPKVQVIHKQKKIPKNDPKSNKKKAVKKAKPTGYTKQQQIKFKELL